MSAIGALLAILVVLEVDGYEVVFHAPDVDAESVDSNSSLKKEPPVGGVTRFPEWDDVVHAIERARHPRDRQDLTDLEEHNSLLKRGGFRLPGFGQPRDDCGECIPESRHFCTDCGNLEAIPRNCFEYDCPMHAAQAIRRRAAGRDHDDHPGVVPKLYSLARRLGSYYGERFNFYHLAVSPPDDYAFESDEPLRRAVGIQDHDGVIPEIMDALGIQGVVAAHSHRGENEEPGADDMGEWRERLPPWSGTNRDWNGDVREELSAEPHFHIVGAAPWRPGDNTLAGTERVEDETGWVIHAIEGQDGSTVIGSDAKNDHEKLKAVARAVTYALSHSLIYDTDDQRRLGAWLKGPDVNSTDVYREHYEKAHTVTQQVASRTLGVNPPSLECDNKVPVDLEENELEDDTLPHLDRPSQQRSPLEAGYHDPLPHGNRPGGTGGAIASTAMGGANDTVAGLERNGVGSVDLENSTGDDASNSTPSSPVRADAGATTNKEDLSDGGGREEDDVDQEDEGLTECGGHLDHISQAGAKLATPEWVAKAPHSDDLDNEYRSYVRYMEKKGLDPEDGRTEIAEWHERGGTDFSELEDDPPPD